MMDIPLRHLDESPEVGPSVLMSEFFEEGHKNKTKKGFFVKNQSKTKNHGNDVHLDKYNSKLKIKASSTTLLQGSKGNLAHQGLQRNVFLCDPEDS